jgi:hypothetical protein
MEAMAHRNRGFSSMIYRARLRMDFLVRSKTRNPVFSGLRDKLQETPIFHGKKQWFSVPIFPRKPIQFLVSEVSEVSEVALNHPLYIGFSWDFPFSSLHFRRGIPVSPWVSPTWPAESPHVRGRPPGSSDIKEGHAIISIYKYRLYIYTLTNKTLVFCRVCL